jgi:hypothetical protein
MEHITRMSAITRRRTVLMNLNPKLSALSPDSQLPEKTGSAWKLATVSWKLN